MLELTKEQRDTIGDLIEDFKTFLKTKEAQEWQKDREDRAALFERHACMHAFLTL